MTREEAQKILRSFSKNLVSLRKKKKMTQVQIAFEAGIDYKNYQKIESANPPDIQFSTLIRLLKFLDISLEHMLK